MWVCGAMWRPPTHTHTADGARQRAGGANRVAVMVAAMMVRAVAVVQDVGHAAPAHTAAAPEQGARIARGQR